MAEHVVLVDEKNRPIGTAPKSNVHTRQTPLHRGFSVFVLNARDELLLQQRAATKKTWPLVWSNSCCGHPADGETDEAAARRRLHHELGLSIAEVQMVLSDYRYRAELNGVMENEFCPVLVAFTDQAPTPNPDEVAAIRWVPWDEFVAEARQQPERYSPWCVEETLLLEADPTFQKLRQQHRTSR
ncbi:MAG: isopentenyl-diphosphate Delta-isomerase [Candidatus Kerfeldbacteria bacterium]|nr:isopentenyl-diphosphate Delta-isomerase [Candidatus Kerfeldbacteria bacterium]